MTDIQNAIAVNKTNIRQMLTMAPYMYQLYRSYATFTDNGAYDNYMNGLEYYYALQDFERQLAKKPEQVTQTLKDMQEALRNRAGALAIFSGNEGAVETFDNTVGAFFSGMDDTTREAADYSALPRPAMREALVIDSQVQYNMVFAPLDELGIEYSGIIDPLSQVLYDGYLTPKLRHGLGAYDTLTIMNRDGLLVCSYRDPTVTETYEVLAGMGEYLETVELTQEDLDRYIISAYSSYAMPLGTLNGAAYAVNQHLSGRPADEKRQRMREMKAMTIQDLRDMAPMLTKLYEDGMHSTAGGAAIIEANKELFAEVLRVE